MSASEKLKALDAPLPENFGEWGDEVRKRGAIFLDALPQLIAVVEAAEWHAQHSPNGTATTQAALAVLEEALE